MSNRADFLAQAGWRPFFSQQLTLEDFQESRPARVASVQRSSLRVLTEEGDLDVTLPQRLRPKTCGPQVTVGDWVMVGNETQQVTRVLERQSLISRVAAGNLPFIQPIAANIDTLFVVTSCNSDFNTSRLERYLALAHEAQVTPVIVLTKADLCPDPAAYVIAARAGAGAAAVETVNATDNSQSYGLLEPWLGRGQTVAFAGSSGVGKSTLINSLLGSRQQATQGIREADGKGRHTKLSREARRATMPRWEVHRENRSFGQMARAAQKRRKKERHGGEED